MGLAAKENKLGLIEAGNAWGVNDGDGYTVVVTAMGTIVGDLGGGLMEKERMVFENAGPINEA
jgi:hypothetical protein